MRKPTPKHKLLPFDAARYLRDEAAVAEYLGAVLETGNADLLLLALGDVARARTLRQHPTLKDCARRNAPLQSGRGRRRPGSAR